MDCQDRVERDSVLRRAVLAGDERAWEAWYQETFDDLYRYILWRSGGRRDRADDIAQETWLTAVRRVRRFDPLRGTFPAWLRGLAANVVRRHLRQQARLWKREQSASGRGGGTPQADAERAEQVAAILDALPERQEAVLRAKYLDGFSVAEIVAAWHETPKAVESLLSRARDAFRGLYPGDEHDRA